MTDTHRIPDNFASNARCRRDGIRLATNLVCSLAPGTRCLPSSRCLCLRHLCIRSRRPFMLVGGDDGWAMTPSGMCRVLKMQCHLFHQRHARERVPRPGGEPDPQSRRMVAFSGYETTSRCRGSGRRCIRRPEIQRTLGYVMAALLLSLFGPRSCCICEMPLISKLCYCTKGCILEV